MNFLLPGEFKSNNALSVNASQPPIGSYSWTAGSMTICCINYGYKMSNQEQHTKVATEPKGSMILFPNPTNKQLTIKYQMEHEGKVSINVFDVMGKKIATWKTPFDANDNTKLCYYSVPESAMNFASGTYIVELSNGFETYTSRIVINKE
jgi:serine protease AprX